MQPKDPNMWLEPMPNCRVPSVAAAKLAADALHGASPEAQELGGSQDPCSLGKLPSTRLRSSNWCQRWCGGRDAARGWRCPPCIKDSTFPGPPTLNRRRARYRTQSLPRTLLILLSQARTQHVRESPQTRLSSGTLPCRRAWWCRAPVRLWPAKAAASRPSLRRP